MSQDMEDDMDESPLNPDEVARYARHIVLAEVGGSGQQRLKASRVLVIGAGGLGSPVLSYLAAAGVGLLGVADDDVVSLSNLQRQILHDTGHVGMAKTESAARALERLNPAHPGGEPSGTDQRRQRRRYPDSL
jgi:molybdopterin/thiamine biosynthesis adenylyltransferase